MPTTFTNTKSYAGELARPYIAAAVKSSDSLTKNVLTVKEGVKYREALRIMDSAGLVQDAACDFTAAGVITLGERFLTPAELMTNVQLCKKDFRSDWESLNTGRGFINDQLPPEFQSFMLLYVASKIGEAIEDNIWKGGTTGLTSTAADGGDSGTTVGDSLTDTFDNNHFTGIQKLLHDGARNYQSTGTGAAWTTTNILTNLDLVIDNLPVALQGDSDVQLCMSPATFYLYYRKLVAAGAHPSLALNAPIAENYLGHPIKVCRGLANEYVVAAKQSNLFFGTDLLSDHNQAQFIDMTPMDGSDNIRIVYRYTAGVQVGVLADAVMVSRTATGS